MRGHSVTAAIRTRILRAGLLAAVVVTCLATPVLAHGTDPTLVPVIGSISPALPPDVVVQVRTGVSEQMLVANPQSSPLTVLDPDGTAFLQVSQAGVFGNVTDPFFSETLNPPGVPPRLPHGARPGANPRWVRLSQSDAFGWFEPRLHPVTPGSEPTGSIVSQWEVRMSWGSTPVTVDGMLERQAITGTFVAEVVRPPRDVQVTIASGRVPALLLVAPPGRQVVVVGDDGRDFLRLDAKGAWANTESRSFRDNVDFADQAESRTGWIKVGEPGRIRWLDTRLQYSADRPPATVEREGKTAELGRWAIPLRIDGTATELAGTISWLPNNTLPRKRGHGGVVWVAASGAAVAVGIGALAAVARRTRGRNSPRPRLPRDNRPFGPPNPNLTDSS